MSFYLQQDSFDKIKVQLRAFGLIARSEKHRSIKDRETYWTLTPYGDTVMTRLIALHRLEKSPSEISDHVSETVLEKAGSVE